MDPSMCVRLTWPRQSRPSSLSSAPTMNAFASMPQSPCSSSSEPIRPMQPTMKIETLLISKIKPWPRNPRRNHDVDAIARSIESFGYLNPIIVQAKTYRVIAGHGRLAALRKSGVDKAPVIVDDLDDQKADLYTLADNK